MNFVHYIKIDSANEVTQNEAQICDDFKDSSVL